MRGGFLLPSITLAVCAIVGSAHATSFVKLRPHESANACPALIDVVKAMTGKRSKDSLYPLFYSDEFGSVDYNETPAFVRSMTSAFGKPDNKPISITMVWPVGKRKNDDAKALYVVGLQRDKWHGEREGAFDPMQIESAGFSVETTYWLAEFSEDMVIAFREDPFAFDFIDYDVRLKGCGNG